MAEQILRNLALAAREPPSLDQSEDYLMYKKKLLIWCQATSTCLNNSQQAVLIISTINDDHKLKKNLNTMLYRSLTLDQAKSPKVDDIITFLDEMFSYDMEVD